LSQSNTSMTRLSTPSRSQYSTSLPRPSSTTPVTSQPTGSNMYIVVTSDGFLRLVSGFPIGPPVTFISSLAGNALPGIPVYRQ
jgi:hypothetical protein